MMIILSNEYNQICFHDIVICSYHTEDAQQGFSHVHPSYTAYMPLQYLLLFPYSDSGWTWTLQLHRQNEQIGRANISQQMYYYYHLFKHLNQVTALLYTQKLAQKYIVDTYIIINQQWLNWIRHYQNQIHADLYNCVTDFLYINNLNQSPLGQKVVLLASYIKSD